MSRAKHRSKTARRGTVLGWMIVLLIACLVAQYVLGIFVNLVVQFPITLPNGNAWSWGLSHSTVLYAHVIVGSFIVLLSLVTLGLSIAYRQWMVLTLSIVATLMVIFAWLSGDEFMVLGQQNASSIRMALGFIAALMAYVGEAFIVFQRRRTVV